MCTDASAHTETKKKSLPQNLMIQSLIKFVFDCTQFSLSKCLQINSVSSKYVQIMTE